MSMRETLMNDLPMMYEDFGEVFVHLGDKKRREFLGMVDIEKENDEVMDSNFTQTKIRVIGKKGDFKAGDFIEHKDEKRRYKVNKVEVVNAEEVDLYVV